MNREEKELLLKDLCARLPYGVKCERYGKAYELVEIDIKRGLVYVWRNDWYTPTSLPYSIKRDDDIRPYLRPMSSMTDEEKKYLRLYYFFEDWYSWTDLIHLHYHEVYVDEIHQLLDWFNAHHLDYRGLIEKGLALEAPKDMYNFE